MGRPSFFIAGHSKSGTTALSRFLGQHPEVFISDPEEVNYFCPSWCRAEGPPSHFVRRTEAEYLDLFAAAAPGQLCGEASATYLYSPESAALIHRFDPAAKIIMIFREPVDFLRSYHAQLLKSAPAEGETERRLRRAIELEPLRRRGEALPAGCLVPELLLYASDRLAYDVHHDRFADRFPAAQIFAIAYDDFRRDNAGVVRRAFEFLGVDPTFEPRLGEHNSGGTQLRSRRAEALIRRATHSGGVLSRLRRAVPQKARKRLVATAYDSFATEPTPEVDPDLAAELRRRAAPHVAALGSRLGRDLPGEWGYADIASAGATAAASEGS